ncbi:hypothetical protein UPYG_G00161780 [Umbra pygmaea]|uniref:SRCR domain-containing protein n=1 Tax=Umbra pygmaea TaxID=75934 RepID=A0ABD0WNB8_UMBPY
MPNKTLSLYYRQLPVTVGNENFLFWGSAALTGDQNQITLDRKLVDTTESFEMACRLEIMDSNQQLYFSKLSDQLTIIAEEAPVRLVSENQGHRCMGQLETKVRSSWGPVCQDAVVQNTYSWNNAMGRVVCRELGCGIMWSTWIKKDIDRQNYSVGSVLCTGIEARLRECPIESVQPYCSLRKGVEMVCSDALPTPQISVSGYGAVSKVYISDEHSLELSCMFNAPWFGMTQLTMDLQRVSTDSYVETIYSKQLASGEKMTTTVHAPVKPGQYTCKISQSVRIVSVIIFVSKWPHFGLIIAGVLTGLTGVAILFAMCFCGAK